MTELTAVDTAQRADCGAIYRICTLLGAACVALLPLVVYALTGGPSEPAIKRPAVLSTSKFVDPFSGDFQYAIPLIELPGPRGSYPFTLSYRSGIATDQEASWVGLGWTLEPGRISRFVRGIPDDISGGDIHQLSYQRPAVKIGAGGSVGAEVFGLDSRLLTIDTRLRLDVFFDNYSGYGLALSVSPNANLAVEDSLGANLGVTASLNTQAGTTVSAKLGLNLGLRNMNPSFGASFSPQTGLDSVYWGYDKVSLFTPSYLAATQRSQKGKRADFSIRVGPEVQGVFPSAELKGYFSKTTFALAATTHGYGYLYLDKGLSADEYPQLDFFREKDSPLKPRTPNLPFTALTADDFSLALPVGPNGSFRAFRNDITVIGDPKVESVNISEGIAGEVGVGSVAHVGGSGYTAVAENESSAWTNNQFAIKARENPIPPEGERVYFALLSELSTETAEVSAQHSEEAQFITLPDTTNADWEVQGMTGPQNPLVTTHGRKSRATYIRAVTEAEVESAQWKSKFKYPSIDRPVFAHDSEDGRIAGFEIVSNNGTRYVFAQPAYVWLEVKCNFAVDPTPSYEGNQAMFQKGQTTVLAPKTEELINNWFRKLSGEDVESVDIKPDEVLPSSTDRFFACASTPSYAYSYYLTSVLGPEYIDSDGIDGPSDGDLGHWVRFEYERVEGYIYRSPYEGAHYSRGYESSYLVDDRGSITVGSKDLYYLERAVTASHELVLTRTKRADGLGARIPQSSESARQERIDKLTLYRLGDDTPIKTVHLEYSYELAGNVPNSDADGKLTLTKVWFEYGRDSSDHRSPYLFTYGEGGVENPNYIGEERFGDKNSDRWGYYQPCEYVRSYSEVDIPNDRCSNGESPYTSQRYLAAGNAMADIHAAAWNLRSITTPSRARIGISYEADDYAYVQDEKAGIMVPAMAPNCVGTEAEITISGHQDPKLCIDLSNAVANSMDTPSTCEDAKVVVERMLAGAEGKTTQLAYSADVLLRPDGPNGAMWQTITGYVEIADGPAYPRDYGCSDSDKFTVNIPLRKAQGQYHPIAYAGWQHLKRNQPQFGVPGVSPVSVNDATRDQLKEAATGLVNMVTHIHDTFKNYAQRAMDKGWADRIRNVRVRLFEPSGFKHGGGARVSKVTICDMNAGEDVDCSDPRYAIGNTYNYTIEEDGKTISSGVAAYEPSLGGDEISLRRAEFFSEYRILAPNDPSYFEHPVAESLFPAPMVGYRRVVERTLAGEYARSNPNSNVSTSGERVYEFYTAKEFPVIVQASVIQKPLPVQNVMNIPGVGVLLEEKFAASQGYRVELNDMHGKQRRVTEYALKADGSRVEGADRETTFIYNEVAKTPHRLDPTHLAVFRVGENEEARGALGQRIEYYADMRYSRASTNSLGLDINVDTIMTLLPTPIPVPWPSYEDSSKESRTSVFHEIVHRNGVLVRMETRDRGAFRVTENRVFDPFLGKPVVITETNTFGDLEYSLVVPSYRLHPQMGPAFLSESNRNLLTAEAVRLHAASDPLVNHERKCKGVPKSPWIRTVKDVLNISLALNWNQGLVDGWLLQRHAIPSVVDDFAAKGGPWVPIATYRFDSVRVNEDAPYPKEDGRYKDDVVIPLSALLDNPINTFEQLVAECAPGWRQTERVRKYHPRGPAIESETPLNRHDTVLFTQKAALVTAVARNARYEEVGYEGFESYGIGKAIAGVHLDDGNIDFWTDAAIAGDNMSGEPVYHRARINRKALVFESAPALLPKDLEKFTLPIDARVWIKTKVGERLCRSVSITNFTEQETSVKGILAESLEFSDRPVLVELPLITPKESRGPPAFGVTTTSGFKKCPRTEITTKAHTGRRALAVHRKTTFEQTRLKLRPGKYVLSAWVSRWETDVPSFASPDSAPEESRRGIGVTIGEQSVLFEPTGPVIDGWQRVEGEFQVNADTAAVQILVQPGSNGRLYIDDIRVHPRDSLLITFAYEPLRNLLVARQDENNVSTRWQYDQAGRLRLIERETVRGWRTVSEHLFHQAEYHP